MSRLYFMLAPALLCIAGCGNRTPANMQIAIADTVQNEPFVADFARFYPNAEHFISYYTGNYGKPTWNSVVTVNGKYQLAMQYQLDIDSSGKKATRISEPHFYLNRIETTILTPGGGSDTTFSDGTDFGPDGWEKIIDANGDLSVMF